MKVCGEGRFRKRNKARVNCKYKRVLVLVGRKEETQSTGKSITGKLTEHTNRKGRPNQNGSEEEVLQSTDDSKKKVFELPTELSCRLWVIKLSC